MRYARSERYRLFVILSVLGILLGLAGTAAVGTASAGQPRYQPYDQY
jgi:hypothetical protein